MNVPVYLKCPTCRQIEIMTTYFGCCPYCNAIRQKETWPDPELEYLFKAIDKLDKESPFYSQISCVFVCSGIELLLENLLSLMAYRDNMWEEVWLLVDPLLEAYQGRERMLMLYTKIGHGSFQNEVKKLGKSKFLINWNDLVKSRNLIVHGHFSDSKFITPIFIENIINDALEVFSKLYNEYNLESLVYKMATEKEERLTKEDIKDLLE